MEHNARSRYTDTHADSSLPFKSAVLTPTGHLHTGKTASKTALFRQY